MSALMTDPPAPAPGSTSPSRRVALYSHDTQGLGHVRRNIEIARSLLRARPATDVLLLSGAAEAVNLPRPDGTELVVLPSVSKSRQGEYSATALDLGLEELLGLRGAMVAAAVEAFRPDLLVVDKEARGLHGELDRALEVAARTPGAGGRPTRVVLGLRDVLDAPLAARRDWERSETSRTVLESYDEIWVYGDREVHDLGAEYALPRPVREMMRFTGYLAEGRQPAEPAPEPASETAFDAARPGTSTTAAVPADPFVLCLVGGGQDGADLAEEFARASFPEGHHGVLVTGPYMPPSTRSRLEQAAAGRRDLTVLGFVRHVGPLLEAAAAVVTMGGYNSVCEVLASHRPALVVPRVVPRMEQAVRAEALARRTHLDVLHPESLSDGALARWLATAVTWPARRHDLDLRGLDALPRLVDDLLDPATPLEQL